MQLFWVYDFNPGLKNKSMITDEDTTKIVNKVIEANTRLFFDKYQMDEKFEGIRKDFSDLQTSVVAFAKGTKDNAEEIKVVNSRVTTQETWIKQAGTKIGLEYNP